MKVTSKDNRFVKSVGAASGGSSSDFQEITVRTEAQFVAAFATLLGGSGRIILAATISLTSSHTFDHTNIQVDGRRNAINFNGYKITVTGSQFDYINCVFVGSVANASSNTSQLFILGDNGAHITQFLSQLNTWYNVVMLNSATNPVIKYDSLAYGAGISFSFIGNSIYSLHADSSDVMDGLSIDFAQAPYAIDIQVQGLRSQQAGTAQERRRYCNSFRVTGTGATQDRSYFLTDGSCVLNGTLPSNFTLINSLIYPQAAATSILDADYILMQKASTGALQKILKSYLTNVVANSETLAADKTLVQTDSTYQFLKTGGADRICFLPTTPTVNKVFIIKNNDNYDSGKKITVKVDTTVVELLWPTKSSTYVWDGTYWRKGDANSGSGYGLSYEDNNILIGSGAKADSTDGGIAIGKNATANSGMVIGGSATANYRSTVVGSGATDNGGIGGVIIGYGAIGSSGAYGYDVIVGAGSTCASSTGVNTLVGRTCSASGTGSAALGYSVTLIDDYQVGLGANAAPKRYGEISHTNNLNRARTAILEWYGSRSNNTPAELFLNGRFGNDKRLTVEANTAGTFRIMIIARDNTSSDAASWIFDGMFKRDTTAASTTVSGLVKTVINRDDATWDCDITADTTNGAVIITITSDAANAVRWSGRGDLIEVTQN